LLVTLGQKLRRRSLPSGTSSWARADAVIDADRRHAELGAYAQRQELDRQTPTAW
jgi:hypothetical protein